MEAGSGMHFPSHEGDFRDGIILPPEDCFRPWIQPSLERRGGILIPVFGLRQKNDIGIGNSGGLREAADFCARQNLNLTQILPINCTGGDHSPFLAITAYGIEPSLIDPSPEVFPGLTKESYELFCHKRFAEENAKQEKINYDFVKGLTFRIHLEAFKNFTRTDIRENSSRAKAFNDFKERDHDYGLNDFTDFRTLMDLNGHSNVWKKWPDEMQDRKNAERIINQSEEARFFKEFYNYTQWCAHTEMENVKEYYDSLKIRLIGNVPFGLSLNSADVWANKELFILDRSMGAPPEPWFKGDPFKEKWGQNWGIRPYNWQAHIDTDFAWWKNRVGLMLRYCHDIFFDHVLGAFEAYIFPWDGEDNEIFAELDYETAKQRCGELTPCYYPDPGQTEESRHFNERLGKLVLSSLVEVTYNKEGVIFVEDAGVSVPEYVRRSLADLNISGIKLIGIEREFGKPDFLDPHNLPSQKVASFGNHDHLSLRDRIEDLIRRINTPEGLRDLKNLLKLARMNLDEVPESYEPELQKKLIIELLHCPANYVVINILDILYKKGAWNSHGFGSWTSRLNERLGEYERDQIVNRLLDSINTTMIESKRI